MNGLVIVTILSVVLLAVRCSGNNQFPCGVPRKGYVDTILGGTIVDARDHPWNAALFHKHEYMIDWEYRCGGTLISDRAILTARHCASDISKSSLLVKLGLQNCETENRNTQSFTISTIHMVTEDQWTDFRNDIALVVLSKMVQFTRAILPACLPTQDVAVGEIGKVVGFGRTETNETSQYLRMLQLPIVYPFKCLRKHRDFCEIIDENQFCAGHTDGRSVCNGDSGGGFLFLRDGAMHVGGLVSFAARRGPFDNRCKEDGY